MLEANEQRLVDVAEGIVRSLPKGEIHTVAAAAMDVNGDTHTGVNVFHFTGGPCTELVAIGAAAGAGAEPLITIVAIGDGERGVIAPCGRCRQVLLDLHPDVYAIVPEDGELRSRPIRDLLPSSYHREDTTDRRRVVYFHPRHFDSIVAGRKNGYGPLPRSTASGTSGVRVRRRAHSPAPRRRSEARQYPESRNADR